MFLITSPNLNINVFNSGSGDQGLFIISYDDKAILNGFICKKISDFTLDNSIIWIYMINNSILFVFYIHFKYY